MRDRPPPWWPEGETWPPERWRGSHGAWGGPGRHGAGWTGRPGWRPFGCLFILFGLFAAGTIVVGLWAAAAIVGLVEAPPVVVAAGIVAFVVVALGAGMAARASRRLAMPLDSLIEASGRIEAGEYGVRVPVEGSGDIRSLARAFNQMSERLEASDARRRAFLADVAHELRTPLTVMQGQLEAIQDGIYAPDAERLAALLSHTRQMTRLVEDLRTISLAEVGALELDPRPIDVSEVAHEAVAAFRGAAAAEGVALDIETPGPVAALADRAALGRVLANLVTNAIRHTPAGGRVVVAARALPAGGASVEVIDDGEGMEPALVERAFERFAKGATSDGSGLGLAIARDLVEAQGGSIELASTPGGGTRVGVTLGPGSTS